MSDPTDPLNTPAPRADEDEAPLGTISAFELTAHREHLLGKHEGEFEDCDEIGCVEARQLLDGKRDQ